LFAKNSVQHTVQHVNTHNNKRPGVNRGAEFRLLALSVISVRKLKQVFPFANQPLARNQLGLVKVIAHVDNFVAQDSDTFGDLGVSKVLHFVLLPRAGDLLSALSVQHGVRHVKHPQRKRPERSGRCVGKPR
jgi:hypothetical protein